MDCFTCCSLTQQLEIMQIVVTLSRTSVKNLAKDLFSIDDLFAQQNFNICLRQPSFGNGISEILRPATKDSEAISIPLRYEYPYGGFFVDYILPSKNETDYEYQRAMFSARYEDYL